MPERWPRSVSRASCSAEGEGTPASRKTAAATARLICVPDAQAHVLRRSLDDADHDRARLDAQFRQAIAEDPEDAFDPFGERSADVLGRPWLDGELDARRLDHEAEAAELSARAGPPAEQTEVEPAGRPDEQSWTDHGGAGLRSGSTP